MGAFLKKDLLLIWRDRNELLLLLLMPFILITILGFSLSSMMENSNDSLHMKVAIVNEDSIDQGLEQFLHDIAAQENMASADEQDLMVGREELEELHPLTILNELLAQDEVQELVESVDMAADAAYDALYNEEIEAVLHIPPDFTYRYLQQHLDEDAESLQMQIQVREEPTIRARIFTELIETFIAGYNLEAAIYRAGSKELNEQGQPPAQGNSESGYGLQQIGGRELLDQLAPISSFQYYVIAISAMFILFVSSSIASKAYLEKRQYIFERIIIAGAPAWKYLGGKMVSGVMIAWTQIMILFATCQLVFGVFSGQGIVFWLGVAFFAFIFSLVIAALGSLLTTINFLFNSQSFSAFFAMTAVSLLAFIGGSFAPRNILPDWINNLALWTPNGLYMTVYFQWMQGASFSQLFGILVNMVILTIVLLVAAVLSFPRRRRA